MFQDIFQESRSKSVTSALIEYQETSQFFTINTRKLRFSAKTCD